ncbi:MAG: FtsQ-type POTRA domain-containing protein [Clostridia bacterium]|nr:FtsQ-type POTRA domain-containing protein [Clostridia bacterium]
MREKGRKSEEKNIIEIHRQRRKRKKKAKKIFLAIILMLIICIGLLFTPVFNLKVIDISGNNVILSEEIISTSGFNAGENIFRFRLKDAGENIAKIPFVDSVSLQRILPQKIEISIVECIPVAYVNVADTVVIVDDEGKVLSEKTPDISYKLPELSDFKFDKYILGEKITLNSDKNLQKTLEIAKDLYNNNLIENVSSIFIENDELCFNMDNDLKVIVGNSDNINSKLTMLKAVLEKLPHGATGKIDARNPKKLRHISE